MFTQYVQSQLKSASNCNFSGYTPSGTMEVQPFGSSSYAADFKDIKDERRRGKSLKSEPKDDHKPNDSQLNHPQRKQNPGVYTCQTCNALFTCLEYYQQHRRHHAESNGVKLFTCNFCPFSTDNSFQFNWHVMKHTGEERHSCQVCSKPQLSTAGTSPMKQEYCSTSNLDTSLGSISDPDDPPSCSMVGKRSVATATTDDLLLSAGTADPINCSQLSSSSCRVTSKGINTCTSMDDSSNFYTLKTIDTSDLIDTDEDEEDDDDGDGDENGADGTTNGAENDSEAEDEEEDDDDDDDDDDTEEEEEEDEDDDYTIPRSPKKLKQSNDAVLELEEIDLVTAVASTVGTKSRGRGKGNRKSRVNSFFEAADGSLMSGEIVRRKFHCSHCGKSFKTKSHLQRHILTHTGEKPYHCNRCGSKFNQSSSLRNHIIAIHTKEYPHYCPNCGKGFLMPALLQKHLSTSHRENK